MRAFTHKFSVAPAKLLIGSKKSYSVTPHPCIVKRQLLASHDDIGTLRDFRAVDPDDFAAIYGPGPPGIPVREFPGIWHCQICGGNSREFCDNCDRLFFFLLFHYLSSFITIYNTLSVNYNVLSINHWSIISIGTKLQFRNPQGPFSGFGPIDPVRIECMQTAERKLRHFVYESHG